MSTSPVGILGSGNIGHTLAVHSVRVGHGVFLANARGPESLGEVVRRLGPQARAASVADAVRHAEIVILAVPWTARQATFEAAGGAAAFAGKIVVDAMNPYTDYPRVKDLGGRPSSAVVASE